VAAAPSDGAGLLVSVSDNGIGIPSDMQRTVFLPFKRLHRGDKYGGMGLGLATCKKIVENHGGSIWCESKVGEGTTFFFTLPRAPPEL
jgi:signal transduction histidine kinase